MNVHTKILENILNSNLTFIFNSSDGSQEHCISVIKEDSHIAYNIQIFLATLCVLIFILGTTINPYVIWLRVKRLEKTFRSVLSLNLFISGFIWSLFLLLNIVYFASGINWPFGSFMCQLNNFMFHLNMFITGFILTLYSIDYYFVVIWTFQYSYYRGPHLSWLETLVAWIIAFCFSIPYFIFKTTHDCQGIIKCLDRFDDTEMTDFWKRGQRVLGVIAFIVGYCIPLLIIFICLITVIAYHQKKTSEYSPALKQIFTFQTLFGVCWLPYHVFSLIKLFSSTFEVNYLDGVAEIVWPIAITLPSLCSCAYPIVFIFLSPDMKIYHPKPYQLNVL